MGKTGYNMTVKILELSKKISYKKYAQYRFYIKRFKEFSQLLKNRIALSIIKRKDIFKKFIINIK